jgi:hypothetical protein
MIINNTPENNAVLSNVFGTSEFRIRNSAKAFKILSDGLYSNKIRAIIRELSCNAVDSHVAAGCADRPFDVHLPNILAPWFSIRDYGVGLNHEQVINIYTTYFESTKTASNDFIGALGLGSKSPFSYTENFTVTAVKDGVCGMYTAFINEQGVPSIALMSSMPTDAANGVEVKFSVNSGDVRKFRDESLEVYQWFAQPPQVSGWDEFAASLNKVRFQYTERNLIPGVHVIDTGKKYASGSYAVMGNIAYPIDVPNAGENLGSLERLLQCNLVMHFDIGELDFQASREGLSYNAQTNQNIQQRLEQLNAVLLDQLTDRVSQVSNVWEKFWLLRSLNEQNIWKSAIAAYAQKNPQVAFNVRTDYGTCVESNQFTLTLDQLAEWNIHLARFYKHSGYSTWSLRDQSPTSKWDPFKSQNVIVGWVFDLRKKQKFVENDTRVGAVQRAKYHARQVNLDDLVTVLEPVDRNKPMNVAAFYAAIHNPPQQMICKVSELSQKPRKTREKSSGVVNIMSLQKRGSGGYAARNEMIWRAAGELSQFKTDAEFYYIPMHGYELVSDHGIRDVKTLYNHIYESGLFNQVTIHGVRKADLNAVQSLPNWINIEQHLVKTLTNFDFNIAGNLFENSIDCYEKLRYHRAVSTLNPQSPYRQLSEKLKFSSVLNINAMHLTALYQLFKIQSPVDSQIAQLRAEATQVLNRYPLLRHIRDDYNLNRVAVMEYINLIDQK